jgi:hypothetical protein
MTVDRQSEAADGPGVPEPTAGILVHLAMSIPGVARCPLCGVVTGRRNRFAKDRTAMKVLH